MPQPLEIWLIRHGETEWSLSGAHTGRTDIPLTERGREQAVALGAHLVGCDFSLVLTSPLQRAAETCRLAGFPGAEVEPNLREWDYGAYEGRTTAEIRQKRRGWSLWDMGVPEGETIQQVAHRAENVVERARAAGGRVALFGHGHTLRILTACWLTLPPAAASHFALGTASIGILGYERETPALLAWAIGSKSSRC